MNKADWGTEVRDYFNWLADDLANRSKSAGFSGHRSDSGSNRENLLIELLNNHLPNRLRATAGGKVVNVDGDLSKQIDIIIKNDLFPRFDQHDKTLVITEAVAGVISVRSHLDTTGLEETIENVASIPKFTRSTLSLTNSSIPRSNVHEDFIANWPFRAVFGYTGIDPEKLYQHALEYYNKNKERVGDFPTMIIVNKGTCIRFLGDGGKLSDDTELPKNYLHPLLLNEKYKGYPIAGMITTLNKYVPWMHYMKFDFSPYIDQAYF